MAAREVGAGSWLDAQSLGQAPTAQQVTRFGSPALWCHDPAVERSRAPPLLFWDRRCRCFGLLRCHCITCALPPSSPVRMRGCTFSGCQTPWSSIHDLPHAASPRSWISHLLSARVKLSTVVSSHVDLLWRRLPAHDILGLWPNSATELQRRYPPRAPQGHGCARTVSVGVREGEVFSCGR